MKWFASGASIQAESYIEPNMPQIRYRVTSYSDTPSACNIKVVLILMKAGTFSRE